MPGGSGRNWESIGGSVTGTDYQSQTLLCDPQTSGGLLLAVEPESAQQVSDLLRDAGCCYQPIGELSQADGESGIQVVL